MALGWVPDQLKNIYDDKRNVILLASCSRSPRLEFGEHLTRQLGCRLQSIVAYDPFQLLVANLHPRSVLRFGHAVGVEQEAIGWFKRQGTPCTQSQVRLRTAARYFPYAAFRPSYSASTVAAGVQQPSRARCGSLC